MNQQDRKEFDIIHLKIDGMKEDITELRREMDVAHRRTEESLSFIKENLIHDFFTGQHFQGNQRFSERKSMISLLSTLLQENRWFSLRKSMIS